MRKGTILQAVLLLGLVTSLFAELYIVKAQDFSLGVSRFSAYKTPTYVNQPVQINPNITSRNQDNLPNQGNKINQVEITNIILSNDRRNPIGIYHDFLFNVTVENKGINVINGLVLNVNLINYNASAYEVRFMETNSNNITFSLAIGEMRIFQGRSFSSFG